MLVGWMPILLNANGLDDNFLYFVQRLLQLLGHFTLTGLIHSNETQIVFPDLFQTLKDN